MSRTSSVLLCLGLVCAAGVATAFPRAGNFLAIQESLRYLPPNIRSYYMEKAGFDMWPAAWVQSESAGLSLVGKWGGGPSVRVTGQDSIVYLSRGSEVVVINYADTANPRVLTTIQAPGLVARSILVGNRLYVSSGYIETFDVSDPASPAKLGSLFARAPAIDVVDTLVYTLYRDSFKVFNFADPANPQLLGACRDSGYDLSVCNGYAYIGDRWGLHVLDVTNPTNPHRVASWGSNVVSVRARGNICCATLADANDNLTFYVLDTRQPGSIAPLGSLADHGGYDLYLADSLVFVSGYYTGSGCEFQILSIKDSLHPRLVGQASTLGDNNGAWASMGRRRAFVADRAEGLQVFDVSAMGNPLHDTTLLAAGSSYDVDVRGDLMAVANEWCGMKLLGIADPAHPVEVSSVDSFYEFPATHAVALRDSFAFMGFDLTPYLRSVWIADSSRPQVVGGCVGVQTLPEDMVLRDTLVYLVGRLRFNIVNVARPREPALVGSCVSNDGVYFGLAVQDTLAFIAGGPSLQVVNISNPASPRIVGNGGRASTGVAVRDTFCYIPYPYDTLFVYSIADPSQLRQLSATPAGVWPWDVALGESKLFVGATYGIDVYDLSNPAQPIRIGGITVPHEVRRLLYSDGLLYAALWEAGVAIYETTATGVAEHAQIGQLSRAPLRAVPNPVNSRLRISGAAGAVRVVVYDAVGRNVGIEAARNKGGAVELNMAGLRSGVYFVEVGENPRTEVLRVVKP